MVYCLDLFHLGVGREGEKEGEGGVEKGGGGEGDRERGREGGSGERDEK